MRQQSLVTLLRVAPAIVKLDRDLIRAVDTDPARQHLLRALVEFARRTGTQLIAEGIETVGELRAVISAGVTFGQGFLLGRPAPRPNPLAAEVRALLAAERGDMHAPGSDPRRTVDLNQVLLELVEALRTADGAGATIDRVIACASAMPGAQRVSVSLARRSGPGAAIADDSAAVEAALIDWVVEHGTPLRVDRVGHDPRVALPLSPGPTIGSFLGVPLLDARGPIGVLAVSSADHAAFSAADECWLRIVAGVATPSIRARHPADDRDGV